MGAALGAAENLGIKGDFKQRVQDVLQPGTSAILVILRKATYDKFVEALRPYGGRGRRRPDRPRTASRDPSRTSDVAVHREQQSGDEANKRAREVDQ
jgi:hypothetical protein